MMHWPPTIHEAAHGLRNGALTANGLLEAALKQLADDRNRYNAMLALNPNAWAEADRADRTLQLRREDCRPLLGIPIVLKDNIDLQGMATTSGCIGLVDAMPLRSATIVERLHAAGAVIVGKSNLSEFSFEIRSRSSLGGDVLNPWDPQSTAGGSSGGAAVAVIRGYCLGAVGTDTGGSIRVPAAYNGLAGFRPAHGSLPMAGIAPLAPSTDTVGPIARNIGDLAIMLAAMGQATDAQDVRGGRVGVVRQLVGEDAAIAQILDAAISRLVSSGVEVVDVPNLPGELRPDQGEHIVDAEFATAFNAYLATNFRSASVPSNLTALVRSGAFLTEYAPCLLARMKTGTSGTSAILDQHRKLAHHLTTMLQAQQINALLFPTSQVIPRELANPRGGWGPELAARSGWPAISVCAGWTAEHRPVGLEILAPQGYESLILAFAKAIEADATPPFPAFP